MTRFQERQAFRRATRTSALNRVLTGALLGVLALGWVLTWRGALSPVWSDALLRQTGSYSYYLLAFTSTLGPLIGTPFLPHWLNAGIKTGWHGLTAGFALTLGLIHGLFSLVGPAGRSLLEVIIPGFARVQTVQMAAGTLGLWLMLIVYATYASRGRIGALVARRLHLLAYPAFMAATLHSVWLGRGSVQAVYVISSVAVGVALMVRLGTLARR